MNAPDPSGSNGARESSPQRRAKARDCAVHASHSVLRPGTFAILRSHAWCGLLIGLVTVRMDRIVRAPFLPSMRNVLIGLGESWGNLRLESTLENAPWPLFCFSRPTIGH